MFSNTNALTEFLPEAPALLAAHRNVSDLEERLSDEIVGMVAKGADLGIVAGTVDASALETYPFRKDRFVLVVARDHPLPGVPRSPSQKCWTMISLASTARARSALPCRGTEWKAITAARAIAQLRRGLPDGRVRSNRHCAGTTARRCANYGDQRCVERRLGTARADDLHPQPAESPYARQLVEHLRAPV